MTTVCGSKMPLLPQRRRPPTVLTGPSTPWSTLQETQGGEELPRERARTPISAAAAPPRGSGAFRATTPQRDKVAACAKHFAAYGAGGERPRLQHRRHERAKSSSKPICLPSNRQSTQGPLPSWRPLTISAACPVPKTAICSARFFGKSWALRALWSATPRRFWSLWLTARPPILREACEHAINAGVDMDMNSRGYVNFLPELVKREGERKPP